VSACRPQPLAPFAAPHHYTTQHSRFILPRGYSSSTARPKMKALLASETSAEPLVFTSHKARNVTNRHVSVFPKVHSDRTIFVIMKLCVLCEVQSAVSCVTENKFRRERLHESTNELLFVLTTQNRHKH
jgi:hypothetical protein